jgi:acyl-CoA synthetase (AMP-forming)/AMP-acid ligase II
MREGRPRKPRAVADSAPMAEAATLAELVTEAGRRHGRHPAFVAPGGEAMSFEDLDRLSDELAAGLARLGLGPGDVLALVLPPSFEYPVAYAAAAKLGAVTAGVNTRLTPREQAAVLAVAEPALVLAHPDHPASATDARVVAPASAADEVFRELRRPGEAPPPVPPDPDRPVAIVFTSGTTGVPKGAVFASRQLGAVTGVDTGWRWGTGGKAVAATSFAHLGFMTKLPGNLVRGTTTFVLERWSPAEALRMVERHRLTSIGGVPTQVALMLDHPSRPTLDLSSVAAVVMGGGPASPELVRRAREGFGAVVMVRYSCTEAGIGTGTSPDAPPEDAEVSVGRPHPVVELTIRDPAGGTLPPGTVGEVCLRSPAVMLGYHRDPAATEAAFTPDGAVRTGDLGLVDDEGRLRLVGRAREMYVRGGYNVFPAEVEAVLEAHPRVRAVAVVPRADPVMGEVGVAVVVPRDPADPPDLPSLRAFGAKHLAGYKLPEDLRLVDALPLTAMDKVDRRALAALVGAQPSDHA